MATEEKGISSGIDAADNGRSSSNGSGTANDLRGRRKSSAAVNQQFSGDLFDPRYEPTQRGLKSRHAQMIAIGGTMGTGLFVSTGQTLARGGPAFILGSFCLMSFLIWCIITCIVEVAAYLPTQGSSMNLFGYRYVSRSLGFAMGWLYFYSLGILVPYEITAAGLVIDYWNPPVNIGVWITISACGKFLLTYLLINHELCSGNRNHWFECSASEVLWRNRVLVRFDQSHHGVRSSARILHHLPRWWSQPRSSRLSVLA